MAYVRMALIRPATEAPTTCRGIVGMSKALELMWTGKIFTAEEALEMGYVSQVVDHDDLMPATLGLAEQIAKMPAVFGTDDQAARLPFAPKPACTSLSKWPTTQWSSPAQPRTPSKAPKPSPKSENQTSRAF